MPGAEEGRAVADGGRPEPGARAVARGGVEGDADDGDVHAFGLADVREAREGTDARVTRRARGVGRPVVRHSATTRSVRSWRSVAPRRLPPSSSVCWM